MFPPGAFGNQGSIPNPNNGVNSNNNWGQQQGGNNYPHGFNTQNQQGQMFPQQQQGQSGQGFVFNPFDFLINKR